MSFRLKNACLLQHHRIAYSWFRTVLHKSHILLTVKTCRCIVYWLLYLYGNIVSILNGQSPFKTDLLFWLLKNTILIKRSYNEFCFLRVKGSKWILMKHFTRSTHALLVTLYTPGMTHNSRLSWNGNNISFHTHILVIEYVKQFILFMLEF